MTYLEQLRELKENNNYDLEKLWNILEEMEEELTPAEMWNIIKYGFSTDELMENLEYIAKEADI